MTIALPKSATEYDHDVSEELLDDHRALSVYYYTKFSQIGAD